MRDQDPAGYHPQSLVDVWPLFGLKITTERLCLRLPRDEECAALCRVAADGVHPLHQRPFLTPWAEGPPRERARFVLQNHWRELASWGINDWQLGLTVFDKDRPIGVVTVRARNFPIVREVTTSSWIGLAHQRHGFGTQARLGALTLAFDHLDAVAALSEVFPDNDASQAVSRRFGYEKDGISRDVRGSEVVVSDRLRLSRERWEAMDRGQVAVSGMEDCRPMFGL